MIIPEHAAQKGGGRAKVLGPLIFLVVAGAVFLLTADVFHPSMDEGIYLEGGRRVLAGQVPYRDFFAYTGPLIYWVQAALEGIFGHELRPLRLSVALSVGLMCLGTYRMAAGFRGWRIGAGTAFVFLGMTAPSLYRLTVNHRWLSAGLMTIGIAAAISATRKNASNGSSRWLWLTAGCTLAAAAWATPSCLVPLCFLLAWQSVVKPDRKYAGYTLAGVLIVSTPALAWLAGTRALGPMVRDILWASRYYSVANRVGYGYYPGGIHAADLLTVFRVLFIPVLIPAILAAGIIAAVRGKWARPRTLLLLLASGMFLTSWPRWDVNQLLFVTPPFYVLLALWCEDYLLDSANRIARAARPLVYVGCLAIAGYFFSILISAVDGFVYFPTRMGMLRNTESDGQALATLGKRIPAGSTVFVFPYIPVIGYLLEARNPTSYSWLQPGMMTPEDENKVMGELTKTPPRFVIRQFLPEEQILTVWPNSNPLLLTFPTIEDFIERDYREVDRVQSDHFILTVLERRGAN